VFDVGHPGALWNAKECVVFIGLPTWLVISADFGSAQESRVRKEDFIKGHLRIQYENVLTFRPFEWKHFGPLHPQTESASYEGVHLQAFLGNLSHNHNDEGSLMTMKEAMGN